MKKVLLLLMALTLISTISFAQKKPIPAVPMVNYPFLQVVKPPDGNNAWAVGNTYQITWMGSNVGKKTKTNTVKIEYRSVGCIYFAETGNPPPGHQTWKGITPRASNSGKYQWTIPSNTREWCYEIRVTENFNSYRTRPLSGTSGMFIIVNR